MTTVTYIECEAGEVERGEESHAGGEEGGEDEVAAGPGQRGPEVRLDQCTLM